MASEPYQLIYYCGAPGRGEHIRLALEEAKAPYEDTASQGFEQCWKTVEAYLGDDFVGENGNTPYYAPPFFRHGDLFISQTSNILMYLGPRLGLAGRKGNDIYRVNAFVLTALDGLSNEVHDTHHPISHDVYWEDQKEESLRSSKEWVKTRLPKHLGYWEKVLANSKGPWLLGESFTYADIVLFQCLDGVQFAFPKALNQARESGKYNHVFELCKAVAARPSIAAYLSSDKRQRYTLGIYRYYEQNDVVAEK
ncbi:glutathione S-transferase protein-like protein [Nemania serpens]|nr:glutathione S-transferase protein-like protein [Nemania serpens]